MMLKKLRLKKEFVGFVIIGGFATLLELVLLYSFTEFLHIWYLYSSILAFTISAVFNFHLNKTLNFKNKNKNYFGQMTIFFMIALGGLLLNTTMIYLLVEKAGLWYIYSKIFAAIAILLWNYFLNSRITFGGLR